VPISWYFTEPEKLRERDKEMYELIVRYMK